MDQEIWIVVPGWITTVPWVRHHMTDTHRHLQLKLYSPAPFLAQCFHQWIAEPELQSVFPHIPPLWTFICFFHSGTTSTVSPASQQPPGHSPSGPSSPNFQVSSPRQVRRCCIKTPFLLVTLKISAWFYYLHPVGWLYGPAGSCFRLSIL